MKTNLLKTVSVLAGLVLFTACPGPKGENKSNIVPTVGPQGHITAFGSDNAFCDIANGSITCSFRDPNTQAVCSSAPRQYDSQNLSSFCQQISAIHAEALQPNACNVSSVTSRILSENCNGQGVNPNPNPNNPINPNLPSARLISCNLKMNNSYPYLLSVPAAGGPGFAFVNLTERRKGLLGFLGIGKTIGQIRVNYMPTQGKIPETLTAVVKYKDAAAGRNVMVKHSGFAGSALNLNASINGTDIEISCNDKLNTRVELNEISNLVCVGSSHMTGSEYEENIQFIQPLNSIVSGEEISVTEAVKLSLDKGTSMLTLRTHIDSTLGPDMTSSSSLRSDVLVEANEGNGKAKITCSIK